MALITRRESGFPDEPSPEPLVRMHAGISKRRLHSCFRLFGLQLAYKVYSSKSGSNAEINLSIASAIDALIEVRSDQRFQGSITAEPRLIFWLEDVG